jgi:hypothetical protein
MSRARRRHAAGSGPNDGCARRGSDLLQRQDRYRRRRLRDREHWDDRAGAGRSWRHDRRGGNERAGEGTGGQTDAPDRPARAHSAARSDAHARAPDRLGVGRRRRSPEPHVPGRSFVGDDPMDPWDGPGAAGGLGRRAARNGGRSEARAMALAQFHARAELRERRGAQRRVRQGRDSRAAGRDRTEQPGARESRTAHDVREHARARGGAEVLPRLRPRIHRARSDTAPDRTRRHHARPDRGARRAAEDRDGALGRAGRDRLRLLTVQRPQPAGAALSGQPA